MRPFVRRRRGTTWESRNHSSPGSLCAMRYPLITSTAAFRLAPLMILALGGCKKIVEAPEDLDGLLHHFWLHADGHEAELVVGMDNLHAVLGADELDATDGEVTTLSTAELDAVGITRNVDPTRAFGMYVTTEFDCDLVTAANVATSPDQNELFGGFQSFERTFDDDYDAFLAGDLTNITWQVDYEVNVPLASPYTATTDGLAYWVDGAEAGRFMITVSWMPQAAEFEGKGSFEQDYRLEVFYERTDGRVRHVEGLWRQMDAGLVNTDNSTIQRAILNYLLERDDTTEEWCASGLP
jgi:hypothetical protein